MRVVGGVASEWRRRFSGGNSAEDSPARSRWLDGEKGDMIEPQLDDLRVYIYLGWFCEVWLMYFETFCYLAEKFRLGKPRT